MKTIIKIFLLALVTVILGIFLIKKNYNSTIEAPNSDSTEKVTFEIEQGATLSTIIDNLVKEGILKEGWAKYFEIYMKLNKLVPKIQAGIYQIPKNLNIKEIASVIQSSKEQAVWVTIPEGLRKDEIANIVGEEFKKADNIEYSAEEFLSLTTDPTFIATLELPYTLVDLEGLLFPDKYSFSIKSDAKSVVETMIKNFKSKVGLTDTYEDIIVASMVEREGRTSEDRPMIADVIMRRYAEDWKLEIDATLLYPKKDWKATITKADKASDNPYNTYKYRGYPPTPICNPGLVSINAVRNPKSNPYYFYIHDKEGNVHFAKTNTEHNSNVQKYLR
ncbi:MAG: endolytic transglycosylase MltG [Candidatus Dojkabacteria bacterium]